MVNLRFVSAFFGALSLLLTANSVLAYEDLLVVNERRLDGVARIVLIMAGGQFKGYCSGVLISPKVVLTARHCIETTPVSSVILGHGGREEPINVQRISTFDMPKKIFNTKNPDGSMVDNFQRDMDKILEKDFVALHLQWPARTAPMTVIPLKSRPGLSQLKLSIFGYPSRSPYYAKAFLGYSVFDIPELVGNIGLCFFDEQDFNEKILTTDCIASSSNSGGPIITRREDGSYFVVGIAIASQTITDQNLLGRNKNTTLMINLTHPEIRNWLELIQK